MKIVNKLCLFIAGSAFIWALMLGGSILTFATVDNAEKSDIAIVLGAAIYENIPDSVLKERIGHATELYRKGKVKRILITGEIDNYRSQSTFFSARAYALEGGVSPLHLFTDTQSENTFQDLLKAKSIMELHKLKSAILVSDPLHMRRAVTVAKDIGLKVSPSPAPISIYQNLSSKLPFFFREMYFYNRYLISGV